MSVLSDRVVNNYSKSYNSGENAYRLRVDTLIDNAYYGALNEHIHACPNLEQLKNKICLHDTVNLPLYQ